MTSVRDNPAPGDWYGICLRPAGSLFASSTTIEFPLVGLRSGTLEGVHQLEGLSIRWADQGIGLDDLQGQMDLSDLDVRDSRGAGVVVNGRGSLNLHSAALVNNGGAGLVRSGGELVFTRGELTGNGLVAAAAANMDLRLGTFGRVTSSTFREGIGMRLSDTQEVLIRANSFSDQQVGITSSNSRPQILSNRFSRNELAMELSGDMVPVRLELNTVHDSDRLLENNAEVEVVATNNWWGTSDSRSIAGRILGAVVWPAILELRSAQSGGFWAGSKLPQSVQRQRCHRIHRWSGRFRGGRGKRSTGRSAQHRRRPGAPIGARSRLSGGLQHHLGRAR